MADAFWDARYPDQATLRREIAAMRDAMVEALLHAVPAEEIRSIYSKGSSQKRWDSPIDYVPELSDVDIHVLFRRDDAAARYLESLEPSLSIQADVERRFRRSVADPVHVPRLQVVIANALHQEPDFLYSPAETVTTVFGESYPLAQVDPEEARGRACRQLLEQEPYLRSGLGLHVFDKPEKHLWPALRTMNWRVTPTGARVLELCGVPFAEAWSMNRTEIARRLREMGEGDLADDYAAYYLHAWDCFLSGYRDTEAVRRSLAAGARVLERGVKLAMDAAQRLRLPI